jgi:N-acylglucosamine 2-epimerase
MNSARSAHRDTASGLAAAYRRTLLDDVVPFWLRHALDPSGAMNNCLDDAGNVLSRDRYVWSQGRALWTFATLCNTFGPQPEWLEVAHGLARWLLQQGRDAHGCWVYRVDEHGRVLQGAESLYVDGFVLDGLAAYYQTTGDADVAQVVSKTVANVLDRLARPGSYGIAPYRLPAGWKAFGVRMIFARVLDQVARALDRPALHAAAIAQADELLADFADTATGLYREFALLDGGFDDRTPEGRVCLPGHVIEAMWFLMDLFAHDPTRRDEMRRCCDLLHRHLDAGWDVEFGGLRLALDVRESEPVGWPQADGKPWWAQVEALVATAYAWAHTGDAWCREWHERVRAYAFARYPVPTGEWRQWLDRRGRPAPSAALPVKDPFHLPRGLMAAAAALERVAAGEEGRP